MSEKNRLSGCDLAAILLAAFFVVVPLAVHPVQNFLKANRNPPTDHGPEPWHSYEWATLGVLLFQLCIFHRQASIADRQRALMKMQVRITDNQFRWTHRPRLIFRLFRPDLDSISVLNEFNVKFTYVNVGETPAYISEIGVRVFWGQGPWTFGAREIHFDDVTRPNLILASGQEIRHVTKSERYPLIDPDPNGHQTGTYFWCAGYIRYRGIDIDGAADAAERRTAFCRRWNYESRTWERIENEDYDYKD